MNRVCFSGVNLVFVIKSVFNRRAIKLHFNLNRQTDRQTDGQVLLFYFISLYIYITYKNKNCIEMFKIDN